MKFGNLIDFCTIHSEITLWINYSNCPYSCTFNCSSFYGFKSLKFYDDSNKEENAIFIDVEELKKFNVKSICAFNYNELDIIIE